MGTVLMQAAAMAPPINVTFLLTFNIRLAMFLKDTASLSTLSVIGESGFKQGEENFIWGGEGVALSHDLSMFMRNETAL